MKIAIRLIAAALIVFFAVPAIYFSFLGKLDNAFAEIICLMIVAAGWAWYEETHR